MMLMSASDIDAWCAAVFVHLRIRVAKDRQSEFRSFLREAIPFYEAPGGIRVRLLADDADPERFIEVVEYIDERSYDQDNDRIESDLTMANLLSRWRLLLAEPPVVEIYREVHEARRPQRR